MGNLTRENAHAQTLWSTCVLYSTSVSLAQSLEKNVLVSVGENTRVVTFSTGSETQSEMEALSKAVRASFTDIIPTGSEILLQVKNEEWGGGFVDMIINADEIADRSILRVVLKPPCEVRYFIKTVHSTS